MNLVEQKQAMWAWTILVALTIGAYFVSAGDHTAKMIVLTIALGKAWVVARYFMELNHAHSTLRRVVDGWLILTACVVLGMFI